MSLMNYPFFVVFKILFRPMACFFPLLLLFLSNHHFELDIDHPSKDNSLTGKSVDMISDAEDMYLLDLYLVHPIIC